MALVVSCLVEKFGTPMGPKVPMIALQSGGENKNSLCIRAFRRFIVANCIHSQNGTESNFRSETMFGGTIVHNAMVYYRHTTESAKGFQILQLLG